MAAACIKECVSKKVGTHVDHLDTDVHPSEKQEWSVYFAVQFTQFNTIKLKKKMPQHDFLFSVIQLNLFKLRLHK